MVTSSRETTARSQLSQDNQASNDLVVHLQRQVANAFVLYANYKHYHWQTFGPMFRDLHLLFDEFADAVLETVDDFAERLRMIGQNPVFRAQEVQQTASVHISGDVRTMKEMIEEADANALVVIRDMREGARIAEEHNDPGTVDLFSRHVQIHEKHQWWLRDILEKDDGFSR
jgi:starvation-inducible DNA-binding protein